MLTSYMGAALTCIKARTVLGTPVPKVYAWCSQATNPVQAEYIIMEKISGVQLEDVWGSLDVDQKIVVVKQLAHHQKTWAATVFRHYGSLYYAQDLDPSISRTLHYVDQDGTEIKDLRFAIGPSVGREFVDDGRCDAQYDRGPCK